VAATLLARRHRLPAAVRVDAGRRSLAFCTSFPSQWRPWNGVLRDRYYVDQPDIIQQKTTWQAFYVCELPAPSLRALRSNACAAARFALNEPDALTFLERWSSVWDVCRIYADVRSALKYWWLESFDRHFRQSFTWDGIDIFPLVRHDLRASLVRDLPYFELLAHRVRHMISHVRPSDLVVMLETFPHGRAVIWGARRANAGVRIVGFQHSVASANQLMYRFMPAELPDMPLPDVFLLYGENAKRMLRASGVPERRLVVTGARRFDSLIECRRRRRDEFAELRRPWSAGARTRIVLVATNFWAEMSRKLVRMCVQAMADRPDTLVIVKPHPNHRVTEEEMQLPAGARARAVVVDSDLNELQAAADVMVGAIGTSDAEALAIGCPVVRVALTHFDLSPTSDQPGASSEVATADELREAVERVLAGGVAADQVDGLVESAFFRLDGLAGERVIAALSALDSSGATVPASAAGHARLIS
jgi:surface carbohydrate biosynthesis protein (TIGR04326 family)